jgi:hypothetical protein
MRPDIEALALRYAFRRGFEAAQRSVRAELAALVREMAELRAEVSETRELFNSMRAINAATKVERTADTPMQ